MGARTERRDAHAYRRDYDMRRREPERRDDLAIGLLCVVLIGFAGLCAWIGMMLGGVADEGGFSESVTEVAGAGEPSEPVIRHDSLAPTYTHDGEAIRWYVLVDPDFGIQYLVNDRGGCCVRLDSYGNVMGAGDERGPRARASCGIIGRMSHLLRGGKEVRAGLPVHHGTRPSRISNLRASRGWRRPTRGPRCGRLRSSSSPRP